VFTAVTEKTEEEWIMSRTKKIVLIAVGVVVVAIAVFLIPTLWFKPWSVDHFYLRIFAQYVLRRPMLLSSLRILEPMGLHFHNAKLDDFSDEFERKEERWFERQRRILRSYNRNRMDEEARLSHDILDWWVTDVLDGYRYTYHFYLVTQQEGVHNDLPDFMIKTHRVDDLRGAEHYVARVSQFGAIFDQVLRNLRIQEEKGILPPLFVIEYVLEDVNKFIGEAPSENVLYVILESSLQDLEDVDAPTKQQLLESLAYEISNTVYPAYGRLIEFLTHQQTIATTDDGVWKLPDGDAFYAYTLQHYTTTDMSADEIHELGLREVARIQNEMRQIMASEGLPTDNLQATMNSLNEQERFLYPDTEEGREQILKDFQAIIDEIDAGAGEFLGVRPTVGVRVERVPKFKEEKAAAGYYDWAPMDQSEPGTFFVNLRDLAEIPKFGMRTLAYHETIPGHHIQLAIAQSLEDLPIFRRVIPFTAYSEGWALYAEELAVEQGYQDDPYDRLGYLTSEVFRAVRLVVDTGIHAKRWTREQAIEYMLVNTGMPEGEVVAEIERYIVSPGQACAYKVGALKILELRSRAIDSLGGEFDLKEFHNVLLTNGAMPLHLIEQQMDRYIAAVLEGEN
jgi:uncharacterized protein (DUF885 family)